MRRYALRDDQWERIRDLLPGREGHVGMTARDNRSFVEAVLYRYRAGIAWRRSGLAIGRMCIGGTADGPEPESGSACFSISRPMPTTNTR